ncbi:suppressor of cytokine signaling 7-like [Carassius auratus]|uniref:Suppressor of cytokine signaling 7-like n=1 Tax=Carassius auratus TaxID=7957 RepID=A0A6P6QDU6_CARAU|nr:suppressor of cytokine signaling 7-like [Carassius auratus]
MNNAQDMSPDFVLMRLVSAAEDDRLDEENGNLSSVAIKGNFECTQNHGHISAVNKAPQASGTEAPDSGGMANRPALSAPPPPLHSAEAHGYDLTHRGGMGPQLLVFRNISRDSEGFVESRSEEQRRAFEDQAALASESGAVDAQHPPTWTLHPQLKLPVVATDTDGAELCHRHRLITDNQDWPPVVDHKTSSVTAQRQLHQLPDGPVLELARKFGELGVAPVPEFLLKDGELQRCSCQSVLGSAGIRQGEDPTETSDALLVLEGLGSEEVNGLGINACQKTESQNAEPGAFALKCFPSVVSGGLCSPACCLLRDSVNTRPQAPASDRLTPEVPTQTKPSQGTPCSSQASTPKSRPDRSATRAHLSPASGGEKTLKVPGKSRKGSLKIRLSKLFRTKSCSGSNNLLDKRPSVTFSISSAGSLVDMSGASGGEQDTASQPGLTRAQSAFSAASFTSVFTGETVSLVDVDISQRGRNSPHPPTPPPPPRRSLSLLGEPHYRCYTPPPSPLFLLSFIHTFHISICFTLSKYFSPILRRILLYPSH